MPSWCLPGRENDPVIERKAILQKSLAFSRTFNSRNLEFYWYPLWAQTLSDLIADVPNLLVAPQFPAWFIPEDDQQEDEDDGDDPEEVDMRESLDAEESAVTRDDDVGELSFASTAPEQHARGVLVDFAILKVSAEPQQRQKNRYGGWRITGANVGLFVEVKRFVSRSLAGGELDQELHVQIAEARGDLIEQAAYLFLQDENKDSVLAIAAAGPYWCNTKIRRADVTASMHLLSVKDPNFQAPAGAQRFDPNLKWSKLLRLDIARSNDRLQTIYNILNGLEVSETPVDM